MDKELQKELKKFLTGRVVVDEEGLLIALPEDIRFSFHGVPDGWESARFRKLVSREQRIRIAEDGESAFYVAIEALQMLGRLIHLESEPRALGCMRHYVLGKSVVLCVYPEGEGAVVVSAYTGKSLLAGASCRRALRDFARALPRSEEEPKKKRKAFKKK